MSYADKCFYFDFGNREIKLEDASHYTFDKYDSISLRKRWAGEDCRTEAISIELWGKDKEEGGREEDSEIILSRDNAMVLATKLMRAVAELDASLYRSYHLDTLEMLEDIHREELDAEDERRHKYGLEWQSPKGGISGALANYISTPRGKDTLKKMENTSESKETD